jgi:hypothetical protein
MSQTLRKPARRGGLVTGLVAVAVIAVAAVAVIKLKTPAPPPKQVIVVPPPLAPPPVVVQKPAVPSKPVEPLRHELSIKSDPPDADVFSGVERLGATPLILKWDESSTLVALVLKKKGYKDSALKVSSDKNHEYVVPLARAHGSTPSHAVSKPNVPAVAPPSSACLRLTPG